ncbi:hypothetical protein B296_00048774, partial [Ensete ventricosum]
LEGQRGTKIATLIPSDRTLADSKLRVDLYRGSTLLECYRGSLFQSIQHKVEER